MPRYDDRRPYYKSRSPDDDYRYDNRHSRYDNKRDRRVSYRDNGSNESIEEIQREYPPGSDPDHPYVRAYTRQMDKPRRGYRGPSVDPHYKAAFDPYSSRRSNYSDDHRR